MPIVHAALCCLFPLAQDAGLDPVHACFPGEDGNLTGRLVHVPRDEVPAGFGPRGGGGGSPSFTILDNGDPANRIDIVFVGDGYQANEMGTYQAHVSTQSTALFSVEPFASYEPFFNVHRVEVVSTDSGVDNDPSQGVLRDTAMNMEYWCADIQRLLCVSTGLARFYAGSAPDDDQVIAVANSTTYGGAGYPSNDIATVAGGNASSAQVYIHELGHSLGDLADEYDYGGPTIYSGPEFPDANASNRTASQLLASGAKWWRWIGTPTPGFDGPVSGYEGARYSEFGAYRPSPNSMMRNLGRPFNAPSVEALLLEFYRIVSPIDDATPVGAATGNDLEFWVEPVRPLSHELTIIWTVDGDEVARDVESVSLCEFGVIPGIHTVAVTVVDETPWVRDEDARDQFMTRTRSWPVGVLPVASDLDANGVLDFNDLVLFLGRFVDGDPSADLAEPDGVLDFADVIAFLESFADPCG